MFKKEYVVTKHQVNSSFSEENQNTTFIGRANTVTEAIRSLVSTLMSEDILKGVIESPYDELTKYQIDEIVYRIDDDIYMITEIIDDDMAPIRHIFETINI